MASRKLKIDAVSWKTRKILSHGMWVSVGKEIDLKDIKVGNVYNCTLSQFIDGRWIIDEISEDK